MLKRLLLSTALAASIGATPALAGVTANSPVTCQTPTRGVQSFIQGTDAPATFKTIYTGNNSGANAGSYCRGAILESNNDGSATHAVTLAVQVSSADYIIDTVTTASNDGYANATPPKNLISPNYVNLASDSDGNPVIFLAPGDKLEVEYATALTSSDRINIVAPTCCDL